MNKADVYRELELLLLEEKKIAAEESLIKFIEYGWHILEPYEFINNWHIEAICEHLEALYRLEIQDLIISIPPRLGKPQPLDTNILMANGSRKKLGELEIGDSIINGKGYIDKVKNIEDKADLECLSFVTHSGREVKGALDHPFLTTSGWQYASDIKKGMSLILLSEREQEYKNIDRRIEEYAILGYFTGDGCVTLKNPGTNKKEIYHNTIICENNETIAYIEECCFNLDIDLKICEYHKKNLNVKTLRLNGSKVQTWIKESGIAGLTSHTKIVPKWIFESSLEKIAVYIGAYFDCDGYVSKPGKSRSYPTVELYSVNNSLMKDIQELLLRFNINSKLRKLRKKYKDGYFDLYVLTLGTLDDIYYFKKYIPLHNSLKKERLKATDYYHPKRYTNHIIDEVVEIQYDIVEDCRCIEIENNPSYISNSFIVHNSTFANVFMPAWCWVQEPSMKILNTSYGADLAVRDSRRSRLLMQSDWYQDQWGDRFNFAGDSNQKHRYENDMGGFRIATSVSGVGTGEGVSLLIVDDILKAKDTYSRAKKDAAILYFKETLSSRYVDPKTFRRVVIGQRLGEDDLTGTLLDMGGWVELKLPMEYVPSVYITKLGWKDPRTVEGELLFPERFNREDVNKLKASLGDPLAVASQLQQDPVPPEGGMIKKNKIKFYYNSPINYDNIIASIDLSFGATGGSNSVVQIWGKKNDSKYLIDEFVDKCDFVGQMQLIRRAVDTHPNIKTILIEKMATGDPMEAVLRTQIDIPFIGIQVRGTSKEDRLSATLPDFENGLILFPHHELYGKSWITETIKEITDFPKGKNDDRVDCLSQAINWLNLQENKNKNYNIFLDIDSDNRATRRDGIVRPSANTSLLPSNFRENRGNLRNFFN